MPAPGTATSRATHQRNWNVWSVCTNCYYFVTVVHFSGTVTGNVLSQFVLFIRLSTAKTHYSVILYNGSSIGNHAPPFMLNSLFGRPYWEHFLNLQMICITDILKLQTWLEFIIPCHAILAPRLLRTNVCMSIPVTGRLHKPVFIKMAKKFITQTFITQTIAAR